MTASLYRRLTDLGSDADAASIARGLGLKAEGLLTTKDAIDAGADAQELAKALLAFAETSGRRTMVALLSVPQAYAIAEGTAYASRVERILRQAAATTPLRARLTDLRGKRICPGDGDGDEIGAVVRLVDGEPLADRTVRESGRQRRAARFTLADEAHEAIRELSERWATSMSGAVERAVLEAASTPKAPTPEGRR